MTTWLVQSEHISIAVQDLAQMTTQQFYPCCQAESELRTPEHKKAQAGQVLNQNHWAL